MKKSSKFKIGDVVEIIGVKPELDKALARVVDFSIPEGWPEIEIKFWEKGHSGESNSEYLNRWWVAERDLKLLYRPKKRAKK